MPAPTKQATPGPSTLVSTASSHQRHAMSTKKRSGSEVVEDTRDTKKAKVEGQILTLSMNGKDKKKKKKKRRRRTSVVLNDAEKPNVKFRSTAPTSAKPKLAVNGDDASTATNVQVDVHEEPVLSSLDKGKGKAKSESPTPTPRAVTPVMQPEQSVASTSGTDQATEIARLKEQLAAQTTLIERHQTHLTSHQQSLTCQICLDLMYKPYALAPCGHITCYGCLVRWFTSPQNDNNTNAAAIGDGIDIILDSNAAKNGTYIRRRKNCPVCRAEVTGRPVEMWDIKGMVATLARSNLIDLPVPVEQPPVAAEEGANNGEIDLWRNVFRRIAPPRRRFGAMGPGFEFFMPPPQANGDREQMGWLDAEDGGIYRCNECHNEIVGGRCSLCDRWYPGHPHAHDDDDDDDNSDDDMGHPFFQGGIQRVLDLMDEDDDEDLDEEELAARDEVLWHLRHAQEQEEAEDDEENMYGDEVNYMALPGVIAPYPPPDAFFTDDEEDDAHHPPVAFFADEEEHSDDDIHVPFDPPAHDRHLFQRAAELLGAPQRHGQGIFTSDSDEEDSEYGGSFIDDDDGGHHEGEIVYQDIDVDDNVDVDDVEDDEVEIVAVRPRPPAASRPRRRVDVVVSSDEDGEVEEVGDPSLLARQLGRGSRIGPREAIARAGPSRAGPAALHQSAAAQDDEDEDPASRRTVGGRRGGGRMLWSEDEDEKE